jgi:preprotein translocase subunit SecE
MDRVRRGGRKIVNRQTKRLLAKQQRQEARGGAGGRAAATGPDGATAGARPKTTATGLPKKKRTPPRQFLREVRNELKKVAWPSRQEVITYTVVVLVSTVFVTLFVFGLDYGFAKAVLKVFGG